MWLRKHLLRRFVARLELELHAFLLGLRLQFENWRGPGRDVKILGPPISTRWSETEAQTRQSSNLDHKEQNLHHDHYK